MISTVEDKNSIAAKKADRRRKKLAKQMLDKNEIPIDQLLSESKISKILTESITKKVIILILAMLIVLPILSDDFYADDSVVCYNILAKLMASYSNISPWNSSKNLTNTISYFIANNSDTSFPIVNISMNGNLYYTNSSIDFHQYRTEEVKYVASQDGSVYITYDVTTDTQTSAILNIIRTLFVCLCLTLASVTFENDTKELVVEPLEIMIEIVENVAKDPVNAKNVENLQSGVKSTMNKIMNKNDKSKKTKDNYEKYEVMVMQKAIIKISALLAIGFGEAGGEIIKENLSSHQDLDPMLKGKKKIAIFGFCDVRNFPDVNEALQEKTMVFVNEIADIVHSCVDKYNGAANKNIGDAFLCVWKFYNDIKSENPTTSEVKKSTKKDNLIEIDPLSPMVQRAADMSVISFLSVIIKINKDLRVLAYRSDPAILEKLQNYRVKMGFGLHLGWAIEGAIGSSYKIDASYLSPNVNMAARLEAATKQYGVSILISGALFDHLSDDLKEICRLIDIVTVKGSIEPVKLYTVDVNLNLSPSKVKKELSIKEKRKKNLEKKSRLMKEIDLVGSVSRIVFGKQSFRELFNIKRSKIFKSTFNDGFKDYIGGKWEQASSKFTQCLEIDPSDGPTKTLLGHLKANDLQAPSNWKGFRELTSK